MSDVQAAIDALSYPPTHAYDVATLTPRGPLAQRVEILIGMCPDFFAAGRFLDVGASKGFFSLRAQRVGSAVLAVEPDSRALAAWAGLCVEPSPSNWEGSVRQFQGTFSDVDLLRHGRFDTVWIGNGPHYLYREDRQWVRRLGALARGQVLMEGPIGRACKDVADWEHVQEEADMRAQMEAEGFELVARADSPTYTPGRAIWYFRRP